MRRYAEVFKCLADETRLAMLAILLKHGELCVCDLMEVLQISQSKASRHLRYLKNARLLDDRRDGLWVYYQISSASTEETQRVLEANSHLISTVLDAGIEKRMLQWLESKSSNRNPCSSARD